MYLSESEGDRLSPSTHGYPTKGRSFSISEATEANLRFTAEPIHPGTLSEAPSLHSYTSASERLRDREVDSKWNHLPYDSLVKLVSANDPFPHFGTRTRDPEVATLYSAASVMSVPRLTLAKSPPPLVHSPPPTHLVHGSRTEDTINQSNTARAKYEEREFAADAIPICPEPDFVISGEAGLVRCVMLNDRIHALAVDTLGGVAVWDVIRGLCLGRYSPEDIASASLSGSITGESGESERSPRESLDLVRERIEGEAVVSPWCMADTKAGVLTIHLMEKCFEAEVYADEVGFATDRHFNEDSKRTLSSF
jgi:WD repeat-containing protein 48